VGLSLESYAIAHVVNRLWYQRAYIVQDGDLHRKYGVSENCSYRTLGVSSALQADVATAHGDRPSLLEGTPRTVREVAEVATASPSGRPSLLDLEEMLTLTFLLKLQQTPAVDLRCYDANDVNFNILGNLVATDHGGRPSLLARQHPAECGLILRCQRGPNGHGVRSLQGSQWTPAVNLRCQDGGHCVPYLRNRYGVIAAMDPGGRPSLLLRRASLRGLLGEGPR